MSWDKVATLRCYRSRRNALIQELGGRCALCGRRWTVDRRGRRQPLQVDHVDGRTWTRAERDRMNRWTRIARYWREYLTGVRLRALCQPCNSGYRPGKER